MKIQNDVLIDVLTNQRINFPSFDLDNTYLKNALQEIRKLAITIHRYDDFFDKSEAESTGYEELIHLVLSCHNLEEFYLNNYKLDDQDKDVTYLIRVLLKSNPSLKKISVTDLKINIDELFQIVELTKPKASIFIQSLGTVENEIKYFNEYKNLKCIKVGKFLSEEHQALYDSLNMNNHEVSLQTYRKFSNYLLHDEKYTIFIPNAEKLSIAEAKVLSNDSRLKGVRIDTDDRKTNYYYYTFDEFIKIKETISHIVSKIKLPNYNDPEREKIIFTQIYNILGKNIGYDHYAISDEGRSDEELQDSCRCLKNGLLGETRNGKKERMCVCAGYASILLTVCNSLGIECNYISSSSPSDDEHAFSIGKNRKYKNGTSDPMGHAYNSVCLDGKWYFCDLTWDAANLKCGKMPRHFLKTYEEFEKSHSDVGFNKDTFCELDMFTQDGMTSRAKSIKLDEYGYDTKVTDEEVMRLFGIATKLQIEEMKSIDYLGGFVAEYLDFVRQCEGKEKIASYFKMMQTIKQVEDLVLSGELDRFLASKIVGAGVSVKATDAQGKEQSKFISIYKPDKDNLEEMKKSVSEMEGESWKTR